MVKRNPQLSWKVVSRLPAVVLPSPHHVGLGITRSLGRFGIPVYNVDAIRWAPAFFSKFCKGNFTWDFDSASPDESLDFLLALADRIGSRCVLIPTTDTTAVFIADHAEALRGSYAFTPLDPLFIRSLCNKSEIQKLAQKVGLPVPETIVPQTRAELLSCLRQWRYPLILKSTDSRFRKRRSKTKVFVRHINEAFALYEQIQDEVVGKIIVQDWIPFGPGSDWMFNGYFNSRSDCVAAFTGRKLRQYPPHIGVTSLGVCERNEALEEVALRFLKSLRYQGPVDMDFRFDERDHQYKLLDVNPRIGGSFRLFVSEEDLDIARILYLDQTGQCCLPGRVKEGRKWAVEDYDLVTAIEYHREGKLKIQEWLRSLHDVKEFGFLSVTDPLPSLFMLRDDLAELVDQFRSQRIPVGPFENNTGDPTPEMSLSNFSDSQGEV